MSRQYSVAQARDNLAGIIHEVESGVPAEITRRGQPVVMVISIHSYQRLTSRGQVFWERLQEYIRSRDLASVEFKDEDFSNLRDHSVGREFPA